MDRNSAEHYNWGKNCEGWRLLSQPDLSVISERVPAGEKESRHYHSKARQLFYILSGEASIEISGSKILLQKDQGLEIPPGIPHQFINESENEVNFLVISQPTSQGDRIED